MVPSCALIPTLRAQTLTDEVHVGPSRRKQDEDKSLKDPSLTARGKSIRVDVNLVLLPVTITDLKNRPVTGLEKDNFKAFEGKEPQDILHFSGEDMPVSLGVIFDTSGSMRTGRARQSWSSSKLPIHKTSSL
jgi:Ca-activated chloride channel family protein